MTTERIRVAQPRRPSLDSGRLLLQRLNQAAVDQETARLLDERAAQTADPRLAAVLRARATERRRRAGRLRLELETDPRVAGPNPLSRGSGHPA